MSVFTKGRDGVLMGSGKFVKLEEGTVVQLAALVGVEEMLSFQQHAFWMEDGNSPIFPCIGPNCPGCSLGDQPAFKVIIPVIQIVSGEKHKKFWTFGKSIAKQLIELEDASGNIVGSVIRVKRTGSGMKTKYTIASTGKFADVSEFEFDMDELIEAVGTTDHDQIVAMLKGAGVPGAGKLSMTATGRKRPVAVKEEEIDEEEGEDEEAEAAAAEAAAVEAVAKEKAAKAAKAVDDTVAKKPRAPKPRVEEDEEDEMLYAPTPAPKRKEKTAVKVSGTKPTTKAKANEELEGWDDEVDSEI